MSDHQHPQDHHDHAGSQTAHHHHDQASGFAEANKEHFNASAALSHFDEPQTIEMARRVAAAFKRQYDFDEETTTVLDFACGNGASAYPSYVIANKMIASGLISRELAGVCKSIVGVDISQALVDNYNERVSNQGISPDEMRAVCIELKGEVNELDGHKFDVVVCSAAYHHIENVDGITKALSFHLKPGGVLLVADFLDLEETNRDGGSSSTTTSSGSLFPDGYQHIVAHMKGFKSDDLRKLFEGAGLTFSIDIVTRAKLHGKDFTVFVARGQKPT
ncbi:S-adenosyl-L-methionine-dependent methyltransferase [Crepidotus variabilis]|uniref:S-adenosyl-L-methionine-dependent methyltransferase n=1 Tax=Crepidotus variabilis TaxID=179855 RepID=A0A9P6ERR7_9AGAR|nr:S-adenosyl-L-methionine-dependent methyltransferase [Crepidotus variabilis]